MEAQTETGIIRHFVLKQPRIKQVSAVNYIERKYAEGYRDIVIAAPTGIGKSAIGASVCFWSQDVEVTGFDPGGYYLVTQKMLQDQLERDFPHYSVREPLYQCKSIKSASEYVCNKHGNCQIGLRRKPVCEAAMNGSCTYRRQLRAWKTATLSVTNYPYLFTEHALVGALQPRRVLVLDECHTLERQILKFVEVTVSEESLRKWIRTIKQVPDVRSVLEFTYFLMNDYLPILRERLEEYEGWEPTTDTPEERKIAQDIVELQNHYGRVALGASTMVNDPDNWVFWQDKNRQGEREAMAKPLDASPFGQDLIFEMGHVRVYMSAYPGSKRVFCKSLGLDPERVAWLNLNSTFPVDNRRICMTMVGSMSKRNREQTMPRFLEFVEKIMECHNDTKGIIHCNSYELGKLIHEALIKTAHGKRLLFPESADERDAIFEKHKRSKGPSVIISPSMTEGFDFANDLARWQIIAKVPYPYLGDRQVAAKKDMNPEWYDLQAVMSIIQACGRIVRSDTDVGDTYILDSDFMILWEKQRDMFPRWWSEALVWPKRRQ